MISNPIVGSLEICSIELPDLLERERGGERVPREYLFNDTKQHDIAVFISSLIIIRRIVNGALERISNGICGRLGGRSWY